MTVTHGPVVIRRRLGWALKQLRVKRKRQLAEIAKLLEVSPSKLSRIETGQVEPKFRDVRDLLNIYDAAESERSQILEWANEAKQPGWWQPFSIEIPNDLDMYISLESEAQSISIYSTPISGLLQTREYAHAILGGAVPTATESELTTLVDVRIGRQAILSTDRDDAAPVDLHAVLDESALHRGPRKGSIMVDQLDALLRHSERPNVTLQVLPFESGYTRATSTFALFEPRVDDDWAVVNVESTGADAYFDSPSTVARFRAIWAEVTTSALDPEASRSRIRAVRDALADHRDDSAATSS